MKCTVCGARMERITSDLPFKTAEQAIVIVKGLPVLQCENCGEFLIEDPVLAQLDKILATVGEDAELEIVRYAA